jgi:hypothetical protein
MWIKDLFDLLIILYLFYFSMIFVIKIDERLAEEFKSAYSIVEMIFVDPFIVDSLKFNIVNY